MRKGMFYGLLFTAPAILGFAIFTLGPMIASLVLSMTNYNVFKEQTAFTGLDNYLRLFSGEDELFYKSLGITFYFVVLRVPAVILISFGIALLLNLNVKGRAIFRTIIYLPSIVPAVASAMIWMWLLNPDLGLINSLLSRLHLPTSNWLYGEGSVIPSVVLTTLWGIGSTVIIFLAGLSGIPRQYYEAIEVDGGGWFRKLSHVTVPMVTPTIFFNTIMTIIGSFQVFNEAYILTQGGPNNRSLFYVFYLWRTGFRDAEMGYASALAWILFVIILFFTFIVFRTSKSWVYYEGGPGLRPSKLSLTAGYGALILISCMFIIPFVWLIRSSLMNLSQIFTMPPEWIPKPFQWGNFHKALTVLPFDVFFKNTLIIVVTVLVGTVITSSIGAFGFSRIPWKGRDAVFAVLMTSMMLPAAVTMIPSFLGWQMMGFYDTLYPLIVPAYFGGGIFNIFLLRQFYLTIPRDFDEAAYVDGANYWQIYTRIIFPLSRSAIIVVALFSFLASWNDFMGPLIYLKSDKWFTLALGLQMFQGTYTAQWDLLMAASATVVLPCVIVFLAGQRYFLEGITLTGLKG